MDKQYYIERMLETENLTDELEDQDAKVVIDWGISQLDNILKDVPDDDTASTKVTALMAIMRKVNHLAGERKSLTRSKLEAELTTLEQLFNQALGLKQHFSGSPITSDLLHQMSARNVLEFLLGKHPQGPEKSYVPA